MDLQKTKIVCTIGPSSESLDTLIDLIKSGMNGPDKSANGSK